MYACPKWMTKTQLIPIRIAKQTLSRKPSSHPSDTRHAVVAERTYNMHKPEKRVKRNDLLDRKTITAEKQIAISAAQRAVCIICPLVSFHHQILAE